MAEKKMFGARIDNDVLKDLKHLSVDKERPVGELVEEAIRDLLKKYKGIHSDPKSLSAFGPADAKCYISRTKCSFLKLKN